MNVLTSFLFASLFEHFFHGFKTCQLFQEVRDQILLYSNY